MPEALADAEAVELIHHAGRLVRGKAELHAAFVEVVDEHVDARPKFEPSSHHAPPLRVR